MRVEAPRVEPYVETVGVAGDEFPAKPSSEPIHQAVYTLDGTVATTVHAGGCPESDGTAVQAAGVKSVVISDSCTSPEFEGTHTIDSIDGLSFLLCKQTTPYRDCRMRLLSLASDSPSIRIRATR